MFDKTKFITCQGDSEGFTTFDGEEGTYSDPQCSLCPWSTLDDDHLERIHAAWLKMSPQGREEVARYYAEAMADAISNEAFQGRHH